MTAQTIKTTDVHNVPSQNDIASKPGRCNRLGGNRKKTRTANPISIRSTMGSNPIIYSFTSLLDSMRMILSNTAGGVCSMGSLFFPN